MAEISTRASGEMELREVDTVQCLIKTHAIRYLAQIGASSVRNVIRSDDGGYLADSANETGSCPCMVIRQTSGGSGCCFGH